MSQKSIPKKKKQTQKTEAINKQVYASIEKPLKTSLICRLPARQTKVENWNQIPDVIG